MLYVIATRLSPLAALIYVGGNVVWALMMLLVTGLSCDDHCSDGSSAWINDRHAWQWHALPALGVACVLLAPLAIVLRRRGILLALIAFVADLAVFLASVWVLLDGRIVEHVHASHALLVLAVAAAGALSITAPRRGRATQAPRH
jgi:hypothetical protein